MCVLRVICLSCGAVSPREELQKRFMAINPGWTAQAGAVAPDGDVFLEDEQVLHFRVPSCEDCGGILKPEVTFFGDTVNKATVQFVHNRLAEADAVLVVGSSLQVCFLKISKTLLHNIIPLYFLDLIGSLLVPKVYSGYRFLLAATDRKIPIAIVNIGPTRADHLTELKVSGRCGEVLPVIQPL